MSNSGWGTTKRDRLSDSSGDELVTPKRNRRQSNPQIKKSNENRVKSREDSLNISDIINQANSILYDENDENGLDTEELSVNRGLKLQGSGIGSRVSTAQSNRSNQSKNSNTCTKNSHSIEVLSDKQAGQNRGQGQGCQHINIPVNNKMSAKSKVTHSGVANASGANKGSVVDANKSQPGISDVLAAISKLQYAGVRH